MSYYISDKCMGCSACERKCPVSAINGERKKQFHINKDLCIECGVCGKICPVSAIQNSSGEICLKMRKEDWPKPKFDYDLCFSCRACKEMCIENCIEMIDNKPMLKEGNKCISCGACENVCGVSAIKLAVI